MAAPLVVLIVRMAYAPKLLTALGSSAWISMKFCAPVIDSIVSTRFWTPDSFRWPPAVVHLAIQIHQAADRRAVHVGDRAQIDQDLALAGRDEALTAAEKSDRIGYISRVSPTRTTETPPSCSVVTIHQ